MSKGPKDVQTVQVIVYRGCHDEKCMLDEEDLAWARSSKGSCMNGRGYSKRDYKEYLLFDREVLPGLSEAVEGGRSAVMLSSHVGMLRLILNELGKLGKSGFALRRSEMGEIPAVFLGDSDKSGGFDHAVVFIVDCYARGGKAIELCLDYGILSRASNVTILVAEELLQGVFKDASKRIVESGRAFYQVFGELLSGQNNVGEQGRSFGIGQCFSHFDITGKTLNIVEPRLADEMPSIFDGLKAKRFESRDAEAGEKGEWLTERLAREALGQVIEELYRSEPEHVTGIRVLRELHLDDLTGPLQQGFCQRAFADGGGILANVARFALGCAPNPEDDGSYKDRHPRFDFAFVDKYSGRLLLAIEVDGDSHRFYEENGFTPLAKDELKDEFVRQIGGLVLNGNDSRQYKAEELERTSFTLLRLPTDGSTFNEIQPSDDANARACRLSIQRLLKDRIEQRIPAALQVVAPHRTVTELELEGLRVPWDVLPEEGGMEKVAIQTRRMKALGLIEMADKRWRPTVKGRQMCGITLALYGANQAECCLYPDATEMRIERGWGIILECGGRA